MASLETVIAQVQTYVATLTGIRKAPSQPPEQMNAFPFAISYPSSGTWRMAPAGSKTGLHNIAIEIHVMRKDLPRDFDKAMDYSDILPNLLFLKLKDDNKWNFTIDTFGAISYTFGPLGYGGVDTLGFRFIVEEVKVQSNVA
jgi:hypothetical protein